MQAINTMTTNELIAEYNTRTRKTIKKFSSRESGEKRVMELRNIIEDDRVLRALVMNLQTKGAAIAATWKNPEIAAKRAERTAVAVDGHGTFKSTSAAFLALKLPMSGHGRFRTALKAAGKMGFEHDGAVFNFSVAPKAQS